MHDANLINTQSRCRPVDDCLVGLLWDIVQPRYLAT